MNVLHGTGLRAVDSQPVGFVRKVAAQMESAGRVIEANREWVGQHHVIGVAERAVPATGNERVIVRIDDRVRI